MITQAATSPERVLGSCSDALVSMGVGGSVAKNELVGWGQWGA